MPVLDVKNLPAIFPFLGLLFILYCAWGALDFIWFHYFRPTSYTKFLHGTKPYALITGATDGIGRGTAKELYAKGFNLILHGRNEEKMKQVVEEVKAVNSTSGLDVKYFIVDVSRSDVDFGGIARQFEGLNITLFVNNVGASFPNNKLYVQSAFALTLYAYQLLRQDRPVGRGPYHKRVEYQCSVSILPHQGLSPVSSQDFSERAGGGRIHRFIRRRRGRSLRLAICRLQSADKTRFPHFTRRRARFLKFQLVVRIRQRWGSTNRDDESCDGACPAPCGRLREAPCGEFWEWEKIRDPASRPPYGLCLRYWDAGNAVRLYCFGGG